VELPDPTRRQKVAAALVSSVVVGVEVVLTTRSQTLRNCPPSMAESARRVTKVRIDHIHADWAGCATIVPLAPTYLGLVALLALAVWARR